MKMEKSIQDLIDLINKLAPDLWNIGLRQNWSLIFNYVVGILIGLVCIWFSLVFFKSRMNDQDRKKEDRDTYRAMHWMFLIGGIIFISLSLNFIGNILINPQYQAIKNLLELAK
jgi:hypothetical protein